MTRGKLRAVATDEDARRTLVTLQEDLVVPELARNLLSVKKLVRRGGEALFCDTPYFTTESGGTRLPLRPAGELYFLNVLPVNRSGGRTSNLRDAYAVAVRAGGGSSDGSGEVTLRHRRLGHRNMDDVQRLGALGVGVPAGIPLGLQD